MSDLEVCEKTLEKRGERHMVPLPLLFNDKNRQVKICLRHRIKNTMASNWTKWAKGTGPTAEKELARKAASKMIQDQAKEVVEKWKASTIEHFGDLDSFTDDEEHLSENKPLSLRYISYALTSAGSHPHDQPEPANQRSESPMG